MHSKACKFRQICRRRLVPIGLGSTKQQPEIYRPEFTSRADLQIFGERGWYFGAVKSMWHASKMLHWRNWNLIENCYTINTKYIVLLQSRIYNEAPVKSVCLTYFYQNIHIFFLLCFFVPPKRGGEGGG